ARRSVACSGSRSPRYAVRARCVARTTEFRILLGGRLVARNVLGYTRSGEPWVQAQGVGQVLRDRVKGRCPSTTRRTVAPDLGPLERCHFATRHGPARAEPSSPRG